jgi:uracil-DNA glycosylase
MSSNYSLFSSYHPSRLNVNTRRLTQEMFFGVFAQIYQALSEVDG